MSTSPGSAIDARVLAAIEASPPKTAVVVGGCGTGRSALLRRLHERIGAYRTQYVDLEQSVSTPERLLDALLAATRFTWPRPSERPSNPAVAFEQVLAFLGGANGPGGAPATLLLDEVLELRTFESFPGLRGVTHRAITGLAATGNRFVLTTRFVKRALRLLRDAGDRYVVLHMPPVAPAEIAGRLAAAPGLGAADAEAFARATVALADGRHGYVSAIVDAVTADASRGGDPVGALAGLLLPGGLLANRCRYSYEMRLHRARGYGALKAILGILSIEEPLTLTEIAHRLGRTAGSTKDYLSWLEDVDLVVSRQKRYSVADPVMRLWVRLHCRPEPPSDDEVSRDVQQYALARLSLADTPAPARLPEPAPEPARLAPPPRPRASGIIEID